MHTSDWAFSLPPCVAFGEIGENCRMIPSAAPQPWSPWNLGTGTHRQGVQPLRRVSTAACSGKGIPSNLSRIEEWRPEQYRCNHPLAGRGTGKLRRRRRKQGLSLEGSRSAEDEGEWCFPGQNDQDEEGRVLIPPLLSRSDASTTVSSIAGEEDLVILDDSFEELEEDDRSRRLYVVCNTLAAGPTPYNDGWDWQKQTLARLAERAHENPLSVNAELDHVLLTQHDPVFTLGTGSTLDNLRFDPDDAPFGEVVRTERGGEVTYHGPGQIVMYPIMNLRRYRQDIHWYLRALEETVIRTLARMGLRGERIEGLTGVWVEGRKVAAVGVRVKRWITMHGLSLNVRPNLEHFKHIVPCGIGDRPVGSLEQLCADDEDVTVERVGLLLLESFEEVFRVSSLPSPLPFPGQEERAL